MTTDTRWTYASRRGLALLGAALAAASCGQAEAGNGSAPDSTSAAAAGRVLNVEVAELERVDFTEEVRLTGSVEANRDVLVAAEESGTVTRLFADKGAVVGAGQPLVKIDDRVLLAQVQQARAQAELARETWERRRRLYEEDNVGSELAYIEARSGAEQAQAALATLERRLERTLVRAPFGGVLDDRLVEVGSMVNPGTPVGRIVDLDPVKVTAGVPERYAADVAAGSEATAVFGVLGGQVHRAAITYVGATVNPQNRTFPVEFTIPNPGRAIKPAMVADVSVVRRTLEDVIVVPQDAVVRVEGGYVAFVVVGDPDAPRVERRPLTLGPSQGNRVVVTNGLEAGDRLVVVGQKQVADGDRVRVVGG